MIEDVPLIPPSRLREGPGVGTVAGVRRPTIRAQQLRNEATPAERKLWSAIHASKLGWKFSRQMPVGPYICDFLSRSAKLAIELDGYSHDLTMARDAKREAFLRSRGITILRFQNSDVTNNLAGVVHAISTALAALPTPNPSRKREGSFVARPCEQGR
jgi:very-short-patch-repair endonuclease